MTLNDRERRNGRYIAYFTEFGKPEFEHITAAARKKESSRLLSHLLTSFLGCIVPMGCRQSPVECGLLPSS